MIGTDVTGDMGAHITERIREFSTRFKIIHWLMAVLILVMFVGGRRFGGEMADADRQFSLVMHSSIGTIVILLLIRRIRFRLTGRAGRPEHDLPAWQALASKAVQYGLYLMLILVPISGMITARNSPLPVRPFGLFDVATGNSASFETVRNFHAIGTRILMALVVLHVAAAIYHRVIRRDGVFQSMWFRLR